MDLIQRPRRLRGSETLRKMVRETRIDKSSLIYPLFVKEGQGIEEEIPSMEGQFRYSVDRLPYELERLTKAGVSNIMLFGIPDHKDEVGSGAYDENGIVQRALREAKKQFVERYEGGESMLQLAQRVYNLLDEVKASGKTCILVAHNGIARVVQSYFYEMTNEEYAAFGVDNCAILQYEFPGEENGGAKA